jgi:hypothetical protein
VRPNNGTAPNAHWLGAWTDVDNTCARHIVRHDDWPGWLFALTLKGGDLIAFEMFGDGAMANDPAVIEDRIAAKEGVWIPHEPETVTKRKMAAVPLRDLEAAIRRRLTGVDGIHASASTAARFMAMAEQRRQPKVKGPRTWTPTETARLCAAYVALSAEADDGKVFASLAEQWEPYVSAKTLRNKISEARGVYLTAPPAGRAGGALTEYAEQLLAEVEKEGQTSGKH